MNNIFNLKNKTSYNKTNNVDIYNFYNNLGYLKYKYNEKNKNTYELSSNNNIKYLVLIACHCSTDYKLLTIIQNIKYFINDSIDIVIINSYGLDYNNELKKVCSQYSKVVYKEIENNKYADFGKWIYGLKTTEYLKYNFVVFTNDSFVITSPIDHYFNLILKNNVELYGYNDSTQRKYHYQSYLFSIKIDAINKFISNYYKFANKINNFEDVIVYYELNMVDWFNTKKSFLNIGMLPYNINNNIFFTNLILYKKLKQLKLLPFIKIKYISSITANVFQIVRNTITSSISPYKYNNNTNDKNVVDENVVDKNVVDKNVVDENVVDETITDNTYVPTPKK
jgi:hypothetical protein